MNSVTGSKLQSPLIDQLKNISCLEHSRHRAFSGFLWNLAAALIAYCHQPKKPSLRLRDTAALSGAVLRLAFGWG